MHPAPGMYPFTLRTRGFRPLITDAEDACALWERLGEIPGWVALCLMLDHLHGLHPKPIVAELARAMSGYTRWFNHRHGAAGPRMEPIRLEAPLPPGEKIDRWQRYAHLNPCRKGHVPDPLAWPFSTHLDCLGYAVKPIRGQVRERDRFHRYVSADPSVHPGGTDLLAVPVGVVPIYRVLAAVSVSTRVPAERVLAQRGPARRLFLAAARELTGATHAEIAAFAGVSARTVRAVDERVPACLAALAQDSRIDPLDAGWLAGARARGARR